MRMIAPLVIMAAVAGGEAQASSFVTLDAMQQPIGPSIIVMGETAGGKAVESQQAPGSSITLTAILLKSPSITVLDETGATSPPSIAALGTPAVATADEQVAAGPEASPRRRVAMAPMIIRGGIVGDAFARPIASSSPAEGVPVSAALDPNDRGTASKRKALNRQTAEQSALQAAQQAAPASLPETE